MITKKEYTVCASCVSAILAEADGVVVTGTITALDGIAYLGREVLANAGPQAFHRHCLALLLGITPTYVGRTKDIGDLLRGLPGQPPFIID